MGFVIFVLFMSGCNGLLLFHAALVLLPYMFLVSYILFFGGMEEVFFLRIEMSFFVLCVSDFPSNLSSLPYLIFL